MLNVKIDYNLSEAKSIVQKKMQTILMKSMFKMEELAIDKAPFDIGELREKITLFPELLSNEYILTSKAHHSEAMEYGTKPYWVPIKPLKEWAGRKLGDPNIGYAVQQSIAKKGIRAQPFMRPSLFEVKNYWLPIFYNQEFNTV